MTTELRIVLYIVIGLFSFGLVYSIFMPTWWEKLLEIKWKDRNRSNSNCITMYIIYSIAILFSIIILTIRFVKKRNI